MSILWASTVDNDPIAEQRAVAFVSRIARLLRAAELPSTDDYIIGPPFWYDRAPALFSGRRGYGPLVMAWDTNLLVDYFEHGTALWRGDLPDDVPHADELDALQVVMALWVVRDIRLLLLPACLSDAKKRLSAQRRAWRVAALSEFTAAISVVADDPPPPPPLVLPDRALERALEHVPAGGDRVLVGQAVRTGAQVFLTRDDRVVAAAPHLRHFGLVLATPGDLLELLAGAGALFCLSDPGHHLYWPMPDLQRATHLARAIPHPEHGHRDAAD